jgi:hypothetical protein
VIEYSLFHPNFIRTVLTPNNRFLLDIQCLSESNRRQKEQQEKDEKKRKDDRDHPGMERYDDPEDFWAEAERANSEKDDG